MLVPRSGGIGLLKSLKGRTAVKSEIDWRAHGQHGNGRARESTEDAQRPSSWTCERDAPAAKVVDMSTSSVLWRRAVAEGVPFESEPAFPAQPYGLPIPNQVLRESSSVGNLDAFFAIGEAWALMVSHFLPDRPLVLDIGCGCGKLARFLSLNPGLRYVGVDVFRPAIDWCRKTFSALPGDRFRFEHFDGYSAVYNPGGKVSPTEYVLPCAAGSVDVTVCASLFTHLLLPDCMHYLAELSRVLKPHGRAIVSLHTQPAQGARFSGDETRIDIAPAYFSELAAEAGLAAKEEIGLIYGQDVYLFERPA